MAFLTLNELKNIGFKSMGNNVFISDKATIYNPHLIEIGNYVRIDDFCILSPTGAGLKIGNHIHIGCYTSLIGKGKITFSDFSGTSGRVSVYSSNDDYSGNYLLGPQMIISERYTHVTSGDVFFGNQTAIGSGSIILPNVNIEQGAVVGANSLVRKDVPTFTIVQGNPARVIGKRTKKVLELQRNFLEELES